MAALEATADLWELGVLMSFAVVVEAMVAAGLAASSRGCEAMAGRVTSSAVRESPADSSLANAPGSGQRLESDLCSQP